MRKYSTNAPAQHMYFIAHGAFIIIFDAQLLIRGQKFLTIQPDPMYARGVYKVHDIFLLRIYL